MILLPQGLPQVQMLRPELWTGGRLRAGPEGPKSMRESVRISGISVGCSDLSARQRHFVSELALRWLWFDRPSAISMHRPPWLGIMMIHLNKWMVSEWLIPKMSNVSKCINSVGPFSFDPHSDSWCLLMCLDGFTIKDEWRRMKVSMDSMWFSSKFLCLKIWYWSSDSPSEFGYAPLNVQINPIVPPFLNNNSVLI